MPVTPDLPSMPRHEDDFACRDILRPVIQKFVRSDFVSDVADGEIFFQRPSRTDLSTRKSLAQPIKDDLDSEILFHLDEGSFTGDVARGTVSGTLLVHRVATATMSGRLQMVKNAQLAWSVNNDNTEDLTITVTYNRDGKQHRTEATTIGRQRIAQDPSLVTVRVWAAQEDKGTDTGMNRKSNLGSSKSGASTRARRHSARPTTIAQSSTPWNRLLLPALSNPALRPPHPCAEDSSSSKDVQLQDLATNGGGDSYGTFDRDTIGQESETSGNLSIPNAATNFLSACEHEQDSDLEDPLKDLETLASQVEREKSSPSSSEQGSEPSEGPVAHWSDKPNSFTSINYSR